MRSRVSGSVCEVEICPENRLVRKRVRRTNQGVENGHDKLLHEAEYMRDVNRYEKWFPAVIGQHYDNDELVVETEYLFDGESLADLIFDQEVSDRYVFESFSYIVNSLFEKFFVPANAAVDKLYWKRCYTERMRRRLERTDELIENSPVDWSELVHCMANGMFLNGVRYSSASDYLEYIISTISFNREFPLSKTYRTHHDLIPENIMIQRGVSRVSDFRLIDPRGVFETGMGCRHFIYDAGKLLFGIDSYGLFRRYYRTGGPFKFWMDSVGGYHLEYQEDNKVIVRLRELRKQFIDQFSILARRLDRRIEDPYKYLLLSYAFMYIPDIPCRMIDEADEELTLLFYSRGLMVLHKLVVELFGKDVLSSDTDGTFVDL